MRAAIVVVAAAAAAVLVLLLSGERNCPSDQVGCATTYGGTGFVVGALVAAAFAGFLAIAWTHPRD